jgi:carbon starvation protein CstA
MGNSIDIAGIIIPDNSPLFLSFIGIHVAAALLCVISGIMAMVTNKANKRHPVYGTFYFQSLLIVFLTSILVSIIRWPLDNHLLVLGTFSFLLAFAGRLVQQSTWKNRVRWHLAGMSGSYIILLTVFYVDNGKNLPLWKLLPEITYWALPALVGIPIATYALLHHPLTKFK